MFASAVSAQRVAHHSQVLMRLSTCSWWHHPRPVHHVGGLLPSSTKSFSHQVCLHDMTLVLSVLHANAVIAGMSVCGRCCLMLACSCQTPPRFRQAQQQHWHQQEMWTAAKSTQVGAPVAGVRPVYPRNLSGMDRPAGSAGYEEKTSTPCTPACYVHPWPLVPCSCQAVVGGDHTGNHTNISVGLV